MNDLRAVTPLREVPTVPVHCGRPMRKFSGVSLGRVVFVYICAAECGHQEKVEADRG